MNTELQNKVWKILPKEFKEEVKKMFKEDLKHPNIHTAAHVTWASHNAMGQRLVDLFSEHNLTSDAEGEEMLICEKSKVMKLYNKFQKDGTFTCLYAAGVLDTLFGSKCLPDNIDSSEPNVDSSHVSVESLEPKPAEPIFKRGDIVVFRGSKCRITDCFSESCYYLTYAEGKYRGQFLGLHKESDLEPYAEPGTSHETSVCENHSDNTSQKEVNMNSNCNLLKDCDKQFDNILKDCFSKERRLNIAAQFMSAMMSNPAIFHQHLNAEEEDYILYGSLEFADALIAECGKGGCLLLSQARPTQGQSRCRRILQF